MTRVPIITSARIGPHSSSSRITGHGAASDVVHRLAGASYIQAITRSTEGLTSLVVLHYENGQKFLIRVQEITHPADLT